MSKIVILVALLGGAGCYHHVVRAGRGDGAAHETRVGWNLFWGIVDAKFDVVDCPDGLAYIESWEPWWNFFISWLSLGIASAWEIEYGCSPTVERERRQAAPVINVYQQSPRERPARRRKAPPPPPVDEGDDDSED